MKNEKLYNYAIESLRKGISVIPVGKDKIPLVKWKIYQERHATEEEVKNWFENLDDPQLGFVTGRISKILVIDIEKDGDPSFLPQDTTIISTGGGGYHYYFKFEEGISNKARIKKLIDFRGEGGYVVAPHSVSNKGPYQIVQEKELLPFPKELFPEMVDIFQYPGLGSQRYFEKKTLNEYPGYGEGQRNDEMARYIGYILTQIHPADWDSEGWHIIEGANGRNTPPLALNELRNTFESIKRTERRNNPLGRVQGPISPKNRVVDDQPMFLDDGSDEIKHIADVAAEQEINSSEVFPLEMPCFDSIIGGGVNLGDVIVIAGQTGHGKTTLAQDWTMSLIRGEKKLKALWFSYEVLPVHLWNKFKEMGMNKEDCAFIPAKHTTGNVMWVEKKIQEGKQKFGIKTVFIDHLGFLLPKTNGVLGKAMAANYATFLTQIMRDLKTIAIQEEVIIFLPVHMKKIDSRNRNADADDIKDSSGIGQESDLVFLIERERNKEKDAKSYFTEKTKITLAKNRKTGITKIADFFMVKGRFAYDNSKDLAEEAYKDFEGVNESVTQNAAPVITPKPYYSDDNDDDVEDYQEPLKF